MKQYLFYILLFLSVIASSCKEDDATDILDSNDFDTFQETGMWAIADLNPYCTYYYKFDKGNIIEYWEYTGNSVVWQDGYLYADDTGEWQLKEKFTYEWNGSELYAMGYRVAILVNNQLEITGQYIKKGKLKRVLGLKSFKDLNSQPDNNTQPGTDTNQAPTFSTTHITVPCEGGDYTIDIQSSIPLYLDTIRTGDKTPEDAIGESNYLDPLYDRSVGPGDIKLSLDSNQLKINVTRTYTDQVSTTQIPIFDYACNCVATITIEQAGDLSLPALKLSENAQSVVSSALMQMSEAMTIMGYDVNSYSIYPSSRMVAPLDVSNDIVYQLWEYYYNAINRILIIDKFDRQQQSAFTAPIDVFKAIAYYNMVVLWGGVPYINEHIDETNVTDLYRTSPETILADLESKLISAIDQLDEKPNVFDTNANDAFFVSKDVARALLADIYLYQNDYAKAKPLLQQIVDNGYYTMNSSNQGIIMGYADQWGGSRTISFGSGSTLPVFTLADVLLSLAECENQTFRPVEAWQCASQVAAALGTFDYTEAPTELFDYITYIRSRSMSNTVGYFAYLKRTGQATTKNGLQQYQLLFPIPYLEIMTNPTLTQNPGY